MFDDEDMMARLESWQLHGAAQDGDIGLVEQLLNQRHEINLFDDIGKTPLHYAVEAGHLNIVTRLLEAGADVNAHDESKIGNTPLNDNAGESSPEMVSRLLEAGADPTISGWMGMNAIHRAAERKDVDAGRVQALLRGWIKKEKKEENS
jgi:ankyrin repeat protein